jgi:hypothetical protein
MYNEYNIIFILLIICCHTFVRILPSNRGHYNFINIIFLINIIFIINKVIPLFLWVKLLLPLATMVINGLDLDSNYTI